MSDSRTVRRTRIHALVDAEMDRTDENYTPGDEKDFESPSVEWYAADVARYMARVAGQGE